MALTKAYEVYERPGLVAAYKMNNVKIYKGSLVGVNGSGWLVSMDHATAGLTFVGVANETVDNSAGSAGDKSLNVTKEGSFVMKADSGYVPAQGDHGADLYAVTNWEVQTGTAGLTNSYKVGTLMTIETAATGDSGVRVRIGAHTA
jgi:hypothetical protein